MEHAIIKVMVTFGQTAQPNHLQRTIVHAVRQIRPSLWQIEFLLPAPTNCWLVDDEDGLTLIDAAHKWACKHILDAIACIGRPLRRIVITHAHPDHAGAAAELARESGAAVMAHENDVPFLNGTSSMANEQGFWACRVVLRTARLLGSLSSPAIEQIQPLSDGDEIASLSVLHTPGHTPGSISLWSEREKAIFCGDNIIYIDGLRCLRSGMPWFTLDLAMQRASMQRYLDLPAGLMLSGHGPIFSGDVTRALSWLRS